jgi:hydroxylysine kinase
VEGERIVARHWVLEGHAKKLPAEVDENFHLVTTEGEFLLKVVPADEPIELTDLVTQALVHVERHGEGLAVQRVVPSAGGDLLVTFEDAAGEERRARLTTFVPGSVLRSVSVDRELRVQIGRVLARLALALRDFDHPAADRELSWDLRHAGRMQGMLDELPPSAGRAELRASLIAFEEGTVPRLMQLPTQVVHNDLSRDNVVLTADGEIAVIDFGDVVRTQRINDVAVAMADHLDESAEPFAPALDLLRGYLAVEPLQAEELALIYDLVRTREITRIVGAEWRATRFPENRGYLARNVERLTAVLAHLPEQPSAADARRLETVIAEAG